MIGAQRDQQEANMAVQPEDSAEEVRRLRRCINDLVSVLALPAMSTGHSPTQIVGNFLDALMSMLSLDFIYAQVGSGSGQEEMFRIAPTLEPKLHPREISEKLRPWLADNSLEIFPLVRNFFDGREIAIVSQRLGLHGEMGLLVAGSGRPDFPQQTERLVLSVAANQAAIGLQEASILRELDQRVAQRTKELTAANEQLHEARSALEKAFDEIKGSEARLRRVIDAIPAIAWCNLPDGPNEFLNKSWHEYTGLAPEQSQGWGWQTAFHPDDLPRLLTKWQEMLVGEDRGEIESRIRRYDGVYRWFLIRAEPFFEQDKLVRWYGTSTDIDDRKRAEEALQESERQLDLIINTIPALAWSASADGSAEFFNDHYLAYVGLPLEQLQGSGWTVAVHPDDLGTLITAWQSMMLAGKGGEIEGRLRRFDGEYRWFLFRTNPVLAESGNILKWYGINADIDDRKRAEEELRNTQTELGRVMRVMTMGQLTASIAHEVSQPLSGIVTNSGTCLRMLNANPPNLDGARETVRRTIRDSNRASEVITRLRALYSKKEPELEPMDLNEATLEVIALLLSELQRNKVTLQQDLAEHLPMVLGDRIQIQQVILNLVRNGSDAMGTLDDHPRELLIKTESDEGGGVRLSVKDTGVGFDFQSEEKLFEAFYTTKTDGMGIGLSVSRSIMQSHRGRLWAVRNEGRGATFLLSIPGDITPIPRSN
jgi:PAS domain S-box-containing protein